MKQYKKHSKNNTKHSKYKYTYYYNTQSIVITPTHYTNKLKEPQYQIHANWISHNTIKYNTNMHKGFFVAWLMGLN